MGQLSEGIYATIPALRLMKRRKISQERLVENLQNIRRLLGVSRIHVTKYGDSFAIYVHMED